MLEKQKFVVFAFVCFGGFGVSEGKFRRSGDDSDEHRRRSQQEASLMIGKFNLVSDPASPEFDEYLKGMEYDEDTQVKFHGIRPATLEFSKQGDTWTVTFHTRIKDWSISFQSGVPFQEELFDFRTAQTTVIVKDNYMEKFQELRDTFTARQIVRFSKKGLKIEFIAHGKHAFQEYKREGEENDDSNEEY